MESTLQLAMKLDPREAHRHLSTVFRQMEVTKFLHSCELEQRHVMDLIPELLQPLQSSGILDTKLQSCSVPTLFGSNTEHMQLALLVILCGKTVDEGFGLAFRLVQQLIIICFEIIMVFNLSKKNVSTIRRNFCLKHSIHQIHLHVTFSMCAIASSLKKLLIARKQCSDYEKIAT